MKEWGRQELPSGYSLVGHFETANDNCCITIIISLEKGNISTPIRAYNRKNSFGCEYSIEDIADHYMSNLTKYYHKYRNLSEEQLKTKYELLQSKVQ